MLLVLLAAYVGSCPFVLGYTARVFGPRSFAMFVTTIVYVPLGFYMRHDDAPGQAYFKRYCNWVYGQESDSPQREG